MTAADSTLPNDQYEALRTGCGLVELAGWSSVTVSGQDRLKFLNNFCTNDLEQLAPGSGCESFFTNVKGKIIGHGWIVDRADQAVILGEPGQEATLIEHLDRYLIREDAQLHDTSTTRTLWLVAGGEPVHQALAEAGLTGDAASATAALTASLGDGAVYGVPWPAIDSPVAYLVEAEAGAAEQLRRTLVAAGAVACGRRAFETVRVEAGLPLLGIDFSAENLPQEVNRNQQAISFTKGCYLGQETVARIDALGHVNRHVVGVRFDAAAVPDPGTELHAGEAAVGRVTSAVESPRAQAPLALAMVRRGHNAPGCQLQSPAGTGHVVALPLPRSQPQ